MKLHSYVITSFLGFVDVIIPFSSHWRSSGMSFEIVSWSKSLRSGYLSSEYAFDLMLSLMNEAAMSIINFFSSTLSLSVPHFSENVVSLFLKRYYW